MFGFHSLIFIKLFHTCGKLVITDLCDGSRLVCRNHFFRLTLHFRLLSFFYKQMLIVLLYMNEPLKISNKIDLANISKQQH